MKAHLHSIFGKTLFDYRRQMFFFSLGIFLLAMMYSTIYPSVSGNDQFTQFFDQLPAAFQTIIGDAGFFGTPEGFINAEIFKLTMPIILTILTMSIGANILSKEEDSGTIELLLARPVSRLKLVTHKAAGMLAVSLAIAVVLLLALRVGSLAVGEFSLDMGKAACAVFMLLLLCWTFGMLTFAVTAAHHGRGVALGVGVVAFIGSYVVNLFSTTVSWLEPLQPLSLFEYYKTEDVFRFGLHWGHVALFVGLIVLFYVVAAVGFARRDVAGH